MTQSEIIEKIVGAHRQRNFAMDQRKAMDAALGALIRTALGWSLAKPADERKEIEERAAEIIKNEEGEFAGLIIASREGKKPFVQIEKDQTRLMSELAMQLPAWKDFGEGVRGFGAVCLAVIVGEAGDLGKYPKPGHLWKRMGLALIDGVRQGGLPKGAAKELWIEHGYNRRRRSRMWTIGDTLIKGNRDGEYRTAYLMRKEYEVARDPEIKKIVAHRRAQRYMEKRLLKHLWQAWRRASNAKSEKTGNVLPVSTHSAEIAA